MQQAPSQDSTDFPLGAHLVTPRRCYMHHGVYVGAAQVVHYEGLSSSLRRKSVALVSLTEFAHGRPVRVLDDAGAAYSGAEVVGRACSRLGEDCYDMLRNNCEHFCSWCLFGVARSRQVERLSSSSRLAAASIQCLLSPRRGLLRHAAQQLRALLLLVPVRRRAQSAGRAPVVEFAPGGGFHSILDRPRERPVHVIEAIGAHDAPQCGRAQTYRSCS